MLVHSQPSTLQVVGIAIVVAIALLLLFPPSRRWLVNAWLQFIGFLDARLLRKHHRDLVIGAVTRRIARIVLHTEGLFAQWLRRSRSWFGWLSTTYLRALTERDDARRRLDEEELKAASGNANHEADAPQLMPLGPSAYWTAQFVLGLGECALTYTALQTWHLGPWLLLIVVLGFGVVGGALGHLLGQAIYRKTVRAAIWIGVACGIYCLILGVMRFNWLANAEDTGGATFANFVGAFALPVLCLGASIIVGSQLRYRTPLEQAEIDHTNAKHHCDALNERGKAAQKALRDRMRARKALKSASIAAYERGFCFAWTIAPIAFPSQEIQLPDSEIDALWPPVPSSGSSPPTAPTRQPSENGTPSRELVVR